jgi:hypothetical protein
VTDYQWLVLREGLPGLLVAASCSVGFWFLVASRPTWLRTLASAHGAIFVVGLLYAVVVSPYSETYPAPNPYILPFFAILGVGVASAAVAVLLAPGRAVLRLLTVLASLVSAAWIWLIGVMGIAHDWL